MNLLGKKVQVYLKTASIQIQGVVESWIDDRLSIRDPKDNSVYHISNATQEAFLIKELPQEVGNLNNFQPINSSSPIQQNTQPNIQPNKKPPQPNIPKVPLQQRQQAHTFDFQAMVMQRLQNTKIEEDNNLYDTPLLRKRKEPITIKEDEIESKEESK